MKKTLRRFSEKQTPRRGKVIDKKIKDEEKRIEHSHDIIKK